MQLEKIKLKGEARECDGYILNIQGDDIFGFNSVEDIEEFVSHYRGGLVASTRWDYEMREQPNGMWLEIRAQPRLENIFVKVHGLEEYYFDAYCACDEHRAEGWLNPYFEIDEALKIAEAVRKELHQDVHYDENSDTFTFIVEEDDDYPQQEYQGVDIDGMHLYPIGKDEWTWYH